MIEALKEEAIVNKVGGRFKLSTLIQKRLVALNAGARPLDLLRQLRRIHQVVAAQPGRRYVGQQRHGDDGQRAGNWGQPQRRQPEECQRQRQTRP